MELEEERRQDRVGQRVEAVTGTDHHIVQEFCNMTLCLLKLTNTFIDKNCNHILVKCDTENYYSGCADGAVWTRCAL